MWLSSYLLALLFYQGFVTSASTSSSTILPPKLSTPQKIIRVKEGQTKVHLKCNLEVGDDPIRYKWMKLYKLVTADLGFAYRTPEKVHLSLHPITPEHAGTYECVASNSVATDVAKIEVIVESDTFSRPVLANQKLPDTSDILNKFAASLNDILAEGDCSCDIMFLMHVSPDAPPETVAAQANFVHTVAGPIISPKIRIAAATYSDYLTFKLSFGKGVNQCALENSLKSLDHRKWSTRTQGILRDALKRFRKSKNECKVLFFPIFGSLGTEGANVIASKNLEKLGVKILILEVTPSPLPWVQEMASQRGGVKPYHWWIPLKMWSTIVSYMPYIPEELSECMAKKNDIDGVCVGEGKNCTMSSQCQGVDYGCVQGVCTSLECSSKPNLPGCCSSSEDSFWCGDVTRSCQPLDAHCNGIIQCMNGRDEEMCFDIPCGKDEGRCQSSSRCLSMYDLCDGEPHCPRAEDEDPKVCHSYSCPTDKPFRCLNGKCIPTDRICDGTYRDCDNGEDENLEYCSEKHVCPASRPFKCDYGICMPEKMVCDGAFNCLDALDEHLCKEYKCSPKRPFKCGDGTCVELALVCNGVVDACNDGMDEYNCTAFICPNERSFKCMNQKCINDQLVCDKKDDCGDASDEANCESPQSTTYSPTPTKMLCSDDEFLCGNGICLAGSKVCNGRHNCLEGEDEDEDLCRTYPCPPERSFHCPDGACVQAKLCDGVPDCPDASDELDCIIVEPTPDRRYEDDNEDINVDHPPPKSGISDHHEEETAIEDISDGFDHINDDTPEAEPLPQDSSLDDDESKPNMDADTESEGGNGGYGISGTTPLLFSLPLSLIAFYQTLTVSLR